jgi:hypothetical protein
VVVFTRTGNLKKASRWDCTSTPRRRNQAQETVKEEKSIV